MQSVKSCSEYTNDDDDDDDDDDGGGDETAVPSQKVSWVSSNRGVAAYQILPEIMLLQTSNCIPI